MMILFLPSSSSFHPSIFTVDGDSRRFSLFFFLFFVFFVFWEVDDAASLFFPFLFFIAED